MRFYRNWKPVNAITFDLDDTFYDNHPYIIAAEKQQFAFMKEHYPESQDKDITFWKQIRRRVLGSQPQLLNDMITLRQTVLRLGLLECGLKGKALEKAVDSVYQHFYFHRSHFVVEPIVKEVLSKLACKYPLAAITNGNVDLDRIGIGEYFQFVLHSSLEQPRKPHPCMFKKALEHLQLPAEKVLHVGDNLEKDVIGAIQSGFRAGWYAHNRTMLLNRERLSVLPDIEFSNLSELTTLI